MPGARKKRVKLGDQTVEGTVMPFTTQQENFNEYLVDDGTVIHIKLVMAEILKIDDAYDAQGNPLYVMNHTNVVSVSAPEDLLNRDQEG